MDTLTDTLVGTLSGTHTGTLEIEERQKSTNCRLPAFLAVFQAFLW